MSKKEFPEGPGQFRIVPEKIVKAADKKLGKGTSLEKSKYMKRLTFKEYLRTKGKQI